MNKKIGVFIFGIFLSVILINIIQAKISDVGVEYNSDLLKALQDRNYADNLISNEHFIGLKIIDDKVWARVMIRLKDNSGTEIVGNKTEKIDLINQREEWFRPKIEEVLKDFSDEDLIVRGELSDGFGAMITQEGFEKLVNDERVGEIIWVQDKMESTDKFLYKSLSFKLFEALFFIVLIFLLVLFIILLFKKRNKVKKK